MHKVQLEPGELDCLKDGMGDLAGEVMGVSENMMVLMQELLGGRTGISHGDDDDDAASSQGASHPRINDGAGDISSMVDAMQAQDQNPKTTRPPAPPQEEDPAHHHASKSLALFYGSRRLQMAQMAMSAPVLFMNLGYTMKHMAGLVEKIVEKCVKGDAKRALQIAGSHVKNLRYMEGRLVANGADIVTELADALQSYQKKDYKTFGQDTGRVFRKVLLSNNANGMLPEGLPGKMVMANVTAGVLRGFFGPGFALDVQTEPGYDPVHIDLHDCVGKNLAFFQTLWGATMLFYSQKEAMGHSSPPINSKDKPSWGTTLAVTMMELPTALRKCNIHDEEKGMLMDAIKRMGSGLDYHLELPDAGGASKDQIANDMAVTVKDWARTDYYSFGEHLGHLLQEMYVELYGQKWSVDEMGTLRKRLVGMAAVQKPIVGASFGVPAARAAKFGLVAAAPLLISLAVLRFRHAFSAPRGRSLLEIHEDPEAQAGDCME